MRGCLGRTALTECGHLLLSGRSPARGRFDNLAEARQRAGGTTCCSVGASKASATVDDILRTSLDVWT